MQGDDPPYLSVGTEVSAKYKGAFCEAKVRKVVKNIKCKVMFKPGLGSALVSDDHIKGLLRVGSQVEAKHPDKAQFFEATISKIQDCSQYTVVFDDGDITTLRRTALCLKSGRHFAESETLDQLPLTHPEHFGTPVLGGRRGGRRREDSSDEEGDEASESGQSESRTGIGNTSSSRRAEDREPDIGKIVCVEVGDKKKGKEPWFPGLIVSPSAQDNVSIRVKDEYLVRSFKDARYYTVPKKEATEFTREIAAKTEINSLRVAIEKAVQYLDKNELPAHWDREVLFDLDDSSSVNDSKVGSDGESSDDETAEEKDHFVAQLFKFMDDSGTPINKAPTINGRDLDLYRLFRTVHKLGGFNRVSNQNGWKSVTQKMVLNTSSNSTSLVKQAFKKYLHGFEDFYRKLGSSMNSPMDRNKSRGKPGRSLIRVRDKASSGPSTPRGEAEEDEKIAVKIEEAPAEPTPVPVIREPDVSPSDAVPAEETEEAPSTIEEEETDEASAVSLPARKPRERSVPLRLLDAVKPPVVNVAKKVEPEDSGEDNDQAENESNSSHSTRSQRGTRNRTVKERTAEDEPQEAIRPSRKRGRSKVDDKDEDEKVSRSKIKEELVATNGKDEPEKKPAKDTEKKSKASGKEGGSKMNKNRKSEESSKQTGVEEISKKVEEEEKSGVEEPTPKRRGRKPKVLGDSEEEEGGRLPAHVDVQIGDKLKVYYGPMQDSKVTYEAKVCEIRNEGPTKLYLVHYTGWNTRYDEWVKRVRIAENLTWTPNRKRSKSAAGQAPRSTSISVPTGPSSGPSSNKVAVPAKRGRGRGQDSSRSATPSSVTSTSSTGQRHANTASGEDNSNNASNKHRPPSSKGGRRRSRRISEMSTVSVDSSNSSSEEEEEEAPRMRKKPTPANNKKATIESEESDPPVEAPEESDRTTPRRRYQQRTRRNSVDGEPVASEPKPTSEVSSENGQAPAAPTVVTSQAPVRRGRRRAVTAPEVASAEPVVVKEEPEDAESGKASPTKVSSENTHLMEEPKGTDFDLKKIRSELKMPTDISQAPPKAKVTSPLPPTQLPTPASTTSPTTQESFPSRSRRGGDDDIYEFREPEPFEFEVRGRRESPFNEDRVHHHRVLAHQQKKPGKEEEEEQEDNSKAVMQKSGSAEGTKAGITSPRNVQSNSSATPVSLTSPSEERSAADASVQLSTSSPPPPSPPSPPVAQSEVASTPQSVIISPPHPVAERLPSSVPTEVLPKSTGAAVSVIQPPMSALPIIMPALSTLSVHSVPSVKPTMKSAAAFVVEVKPEEEGGEDDDSDDDDRMRPKRERRKTGGRKPALSREFIEDSDDDSPEDRPMKKETVTKKDAGLKSADEKTTSSSESTPSETAEDTADDAQVSPTTSRKLSAAIISSSKVKTEEDLDESSLLCEETIPGSPVTHCAPPSVDISESAVLAVPSTSRSTEMPFASAPSVPHLPRTRGLSGGPSSAAARAVNRKRGLRQALAMQRPGLRPVGNGGAGPSALTENTPPTTPDGSISSSSNSPQGDHGNLSPEHESSVKSEREFSENDQPIVSSGQPTPSNATLTSIVPARTVGPRASATLATTPSFPTPLIKRKEDETSRSQEDESPVKRRRRGGGSDAATSSSRRGRGGMHGRSPRRTGSDSEDTPVEYLSSSSSTMGNNSGCVGLASYQPRSTRYNFCTELDPEMDASQRIASLQEKLRELRQTYSALKARVVVIDRRRKKLKRKEKESTTS